VGQQATGGGEHVAVGRNDWLRSPLWGPDEEARFEAKLARARPAWRSQYLRVKGCALAEASDETARNAARMLVERAIAADDRLQSTWARFDLARWFEPAGDPESAAESYRACPKAEEATGKTGFTRAELHLASDVRGSAVAALRCHRSRMRPERMARRSACGGADSAAAACVEQTDFARHPNVGRVNSEPIAAAEMKALGAKQ